MFSPSLDFCPLYKVSCSLRVNLPGSDNLQNEHPQGQEWGHQQKGRRFRRRCRQWRTQRPSASQIAGPSGRQSNFDLDDFKTINDTYGHNAGDEVLRKIANGVRTLIRKVDLFSRFGGDEFIILMPGLEIAQAKFVAERIRSHIAKLPVLVGSGSVNITASFGLTGTYVDGAQKMDDLLELADSALYQAKNQGNNQIGVTNPIP